MYGKKTGYKKRATANSRKRSGNSPRKAAKKKATKRNHAPRAGGDGR